MKTKILFILSSCLLPLSSLHLSANVFTTLEDTADHLTADATRGLRPSQGTRKGGAKKRKLTDIEFAQQYDFSDKNNNFLILNATSIFMNIEITQQTTEKESVTTAQQSPLSIKYTLAPGEHKTFKSTSKSSCWQTAYAYYDEGNNQKTKKALQLKDLRPQCGSFIVAIIRIPVKSTMKISDFGKTRTQTWQYKLLHGHAAKEYIENYKAPAKPEFLQ